jgi:hypothetical protein
MVKLKRGAGFLDRHKSSKYLWYCPGLDGWRENTVDRKQKLEGIPVPKIWLSNQGWLQIKLELHLSAWSMYFYFHVWKYFTKMPILFKILILFKFYLWLNLFELLNEHVHLFIQCYFISLWFNIFPHLATINILNSLCPLKNSRCRTD